MNDPIKDEIEKAVPQVKSLLQESIDFYDTQLPSVDQGQVETPETSQPQTETSTEVEQTQEKEPLKQGENPLQNREDFDANVQIYREGMKKSFSESFGKQSGNVLNPLNWANYPAAAGAGYTDFLVDTVNLIPGVNVPKLPKYESSSLQGVRQMSSIIIPSMSLTNLFRKGALGIHGKLKWALGDKRFVKWFGNMGLATGAGAIVDQINEYNEFDDNATGSLKKMWPQAYGWVPDEIATLDSDSPDTKRMKNRNEGIGLSIFGDVFLGATKIARALKNTDEALSWIPKNEEASKFVKKAFKKTKKGDIETEITVNNQRRVKEFDEIGRYNLELAGDIDLDNPIKGVHDVYDDYEVGFRSTDPGGIVSAQFDSVRIAKNIDSVHGDVGSIYSDSALKATINSKDGGHMTFKELVKQIKLDVEWHSPKGVKITHKQAVEVGEDIAAALYEFDDTSQMKRLLSNFEGVDVDTGAKVLKTEGYVGVTKAITKYFDDYMNMDLARAQGYVSESLADQVTGLAEGMRVMDGTTAVQNAQEQILDRLQFLMTIKGQTAYARGRALNMLNLWNRLNPFSKYGKKLDFSNYGGKKKVMDNAYKYLKENSEETLQNFEEIAEESAQAIETIRALSKEKPEMLKPLFLAYEFTDGRVKDIATLNRYFKESTGVFKKALIDTNGEFDSMFMQGVWGNIYNSVLSAVGTPLKAFASNLAIMVERPITTYAGAILSRDIDTIRKANYMYFSGIGENTQRAMDHFKTVFRKAWTDPGSVGYIMRSDIAIKNEGNIKALKAIAEVAEKEGNHGPSVLVERIEMMNDIAEHPWLRYSANSMTAMDGFTRAWIGSIEAKGRAFDQVMSKGQKLTAARVNRIQKKAYDQMFDSNGMITDTGVEYASKEIAMNLDNPAVDSLNVLIKKIPLLRPFLMFPKTATNMMAFTATHSPAGLFFDQLNKFGKPFEEMAQSDVLRLLQERGIDTKNVNLQSAYNTIRAELKGRKAVGMLMVSGAAAMFTGDRLHGNGIYDKTRQRTRQQLNWKPRSFKGWDGKWYSYEGLGAISDWIAITADVMDNFDVPTLGAFGPGTNVGTLDENSLEVNMGKMAYILGANLTNKSFLAGLEPMFDVLQGNPSAISRWTASFGSGLLPYSGLRNEFSRVLTPQLKEQEQELIQLFFNRNPILKSQLPNAYDWMDGGLIREPDNFFVRAWNAYSPVFKVGEEMSPEKEFLVEIEFDGRPQLNKNGNGIEYTPEERSQVTELMGQDGYFKEQVTKIMNSPDGREFRSLYKKAAKSGAVIDRKKFISLQIKVNDALRKAQMYAEKRIQNRGSVQEKTYYNERIKKATERGDIDEILLLQKEAARL